MEKIRKLYWFGIESTYNRVKKQKDLYLVNLFTDGNTILISLGYKYYMIDFKCHWFGQMEKLEKNLKKKTVYSRKI